MAKASDLEVIIGGWYKQANLPHLPKDVTKWLAENIWWLALIGAIVSVIALVGVLPIFLAAIAVTSLMTTATLAYAPLATAAYSGLFWVGALSSVISFVLTTVLLVASISPLKAKAKKGWRLLFWSYLINFALAVVGDVFTLNLVGIIAAAVGAAIAGYFLYEIQSYFGAKHKEAHHVKAEAK